MPRWCGTGLRSCYPDSMSQLDEEVDRLYQLPAGEFVAARNALAKRAGPGAEAIKSLQKPNMPAWAVNQLFWTRRKAFDRLMDAAKKLRAAHSQMLSGKRADVAAAEAAHREAMKEATTGVREILSAAGDPATSATMNAVTETLEALPGPEQPGRLVRPLKPRGFEALAGIVPGAAAASSAGTRFGDSPRRAVAAVARRATSARRCAAPRPRTFPLGRPGPGKSMRARPRKQQSRGLASCAS